MNIDMHISFHISVLSEINQPEKDKRRMISFMWNPMNNLN